MPVPPSAPSKFAPLLWWLILAAFVVLGGTWAALGVLANTAERDNLRTELRLAQLELTNQQQIREAERILARHEWAHTLAAYTIIPLTYTGAGTPPAVVLVWDSARQQLILIGGPLSGPTNVNWRWQIRQRNTAPWVDSVVVDAQTATFRALATLTTDMTPEASIEVDLWAEQAGFPPLRWRGVVPKPGR